MDGFWITVVGLGIGLAAVLAAIHPFSIRFLATWRLARFMQKIKLGAVPQSGWVAVNGTLDHAIAISSGGEGEENAPVHMPVWLSQGAGERFLAELQELRISGAPVNGRVIPVVMFELLEVSEEEDSHAG